VSKSDESKRGPSSSDGMQAQPQQQAGTAAAGGRLVSCLSNTAMCSHQLCRPVSYGCTPHTVLLRTLPNPPLIILTASVLQQHDCIGGAAEVPQAAGW
jgi:hypothetical protein